MSTSYYMAESARSPGSILDEMRREISGILDRSPYAVGGDVVAEPQGFTYPQPVYNWQHPYPLMMASGDDFRLILMGVFFLLALAIIVRK